MNANKAILFFLGFVFIAIVILSSKRISGFLRERLGKFIPFPKITATITPTPTIFKVTPTPSATPTRAVSNNTTGTYTGTAPSQIPATGPSELTWLLLSGSFLTGFSLKRISKRKPL